MWLDVWFLNPQQQSTPSAAYQFSSLPQPLQDLATTSAGFLKGKVGQQAAPYPYALAAPLSNDQQRSIAAGRQLAGSWMPTAQPTANAVGGILSGAALPQNSPYIRGLLGTLATQEGQDLQALHSTYGASPGVNEGVIGMEGNLRQQYANQAMSTLLQQYNTGIQQQIQTMPYGMALPQVGQQALASGGALQANALQQYLNAAYQEYQRQINGQWQAVGAASPLVQQAYTPIPQQTTTAPSIFSQLLSGADVAAQMGAFDSGGVGSLLGL